MLFRSSYAVVATVVAVIGSTSSPTTNAFIFDAFNGFAGLKDLATKVETDKKLAIRLDISPSKDSSPESPGLSLAGLQLGLSTDMAGPTSQRVKLPGADGPNPKTSSGARALNVESLPYYIGLDGMEKVKLENGAWEMIWWKNSKSGALICGFDCPNAVTRGEATLPSGRLYVSFHVWTPELLEEQQNSKAEAEKSATKYMEEKEENIRKYQSESNILMKAWHFRNAAAAMEKCDLTGVRYYKHVPGMDAAEADVVRIHDGLVASNTGAVFNINNDILKTKTKIGDAFIVPQNNKAVDPETELRP